MASFVLPAHVSALRVEMLNLEEQADNAKARELFWKPMAWLGAIRPTTANDAFDPALWETFVSTTLGLEVPTLASLPRLHNSPLAKYGCKKFCMDFHGDHTSTCTAHSGATKDGECHDWMVSVLGPLFRTAGHTVRTQPGVTASAGQQRRDIEVRNYLRDQAGSRSLVFDLSIAQKEKKALLFSSSVPPSLPPPCHSPPLPCPLHPSSVLPQARQASCLSELNGKRNDTQVVAFIE